ncbi:MAG: peptidylprolyl isomerase [Armatimonadota bacterium]
MIPIWVLASLTVAGIQGAAPAAPPAVPGKPAKGVKPAQPPKPKKLERPVMTVATPKGVVRIELFPIDAPRNVANLVSLAQRKFYDSLKFHRIEDWVAQGGDPNGDGTGGPGYTVENERNRALKHVRGAVGMANSGRDTAGSQFYILKKDAPGLDNGAYTLVGMVISGMEIVDGLAAGDTIQTATVELPSGFKPAPFGPSRPAEASQLFLPDLPDDIAQRTAAPTVRLAVKVAIDGAATVVLVKGSGYVDLDDRVLDAIRRWKWSPALRFGQAVPSEERFDYDYVVGGRTRVP